ncbi:MAG: hypothetical protein MUF84_20475, partial [Anaerolineae bacterium]|nr:hypothetical protein [Anaerolineae bacterium]
DETGAPLVDMVLDEAKQKGTGKWASQDSLDVGAPIPTINAAVEARIISAYKDERVAASRVLSGPEPSFDGDVEAFIGQAEDALYIAKICSYAQGFALLRAASAEYGYDLNYGEIARIWRGGCIIRAALLQDIRAAFAADPQLPNLLMDRAFGASVVARQGALREVVAFGVRNGISVAALASAVPTDGWTGKGRSTRSGRTLRSCPSRRAGRRRHKR